MNNYFYSLSTGGFYQTAQHSVIPSDALEITRDEYNRLLSGATGGMEIVVGINGAPELVAPAVDYVSQAQQIKNARRMASDAEISWRQDAVDAGIATTGETTALADWKKYRVLLMRVDISAAPDIEWPTQPGIQAS